MSIYILFFQGVSFGIFISIIGLVSLLYYVFEYLNKHRVFNQTEKLDLENNAAQSTAGIPPSEVVVEFLKRKPQAGNELLAVDFMNLFIHRLFLSWQQSTTFKTIWGNKMAGKINAKLTGDSYISNLKITDVVLGESPPMITNLNSNILEDLAFLLELEMVYRGGAMIKTIITLYNGLEIPLQIILNGFKGTLNVRIPSEKQPNLMAFAFQEDPGVSFTIDAPIIPALNEILRNIINKILARIMKRLFLDLWVLPSWRTNYLPLFDPGNIIYKPELITKTEPKATSKGIAAKASMIWESKLKRPVIKSADPFSSLLSVTEIINPSQKEMLESYGEKLVNALTEQLEFKEKPSPNHGLVDTELQGIWITIKKNPNILIERKSTDAEIGLSVIMRSSLILNFNFNHVFGLISNPVFLKELSSSIVSTTKVNDGFGWEIYDCYFSNARALTLMPLIVTKKIGVDHFYVVFRSIGGCTDIPPENSATKEEVANNQLKFEDGHKFPDLQSEIGNELSKSFSAESAFDTDDQSDLYPSTDTPKFLVDQETLGSNTKIDIEYQRTNSELHIYLLGFKISQIDETTCEISIVSSCSNALNSLSADYKFCKRLQKYIETHLISNPLDHQSTSPQEKSAAKLVGKLGSKLGNTLSNANSILRNRKLTKSSEEIKSMLSNPVNYKYLSEIKYTEFSIAPREILTKEIEFERSRYSENVMLQWQFISKLEQAPMFGIHFVPTSNNLVGIEKCLPSVGFNKCIIFPLSSCKSVASQSSGSISISDFQSGKFILIWDNSNAFAGRNAKLIAYKAVIVSGNEMLQIKSSVVIPRKQLFSLPIIFTGDINNSLQVTFTGGGGIFFGAELEKLDSKSQQSGENEFNVPLSNSRDVVVPFSKLASGDTSASYNIKLNRGHGVYYLIWDNTQSLVSTKHIEFHASIQLSLAN